MTTATSLAAKFDPAEVGRLAAAILAEIEAAKADPGDRIPAWVFTFSGLHDWCDANEFLIGGIPQPEGMDGETWNDLVTVVEDEVNSRMVAAEVARGRQVTEPGDGFTEVLTQCSHRFPARLAETGGTSVPCPAEDERHGGPCPCRVDLPAPTADPVISVRWTLGPW
jgi:hypothetical protein